MGERQRVKERERERERAEMKERRAVEDMGEEKREK